ncbi:hypothetical protein [Psychrobacillus sp. OK032]|nr:hypothetical protein [Psychrobacillus sp. OK032]
MTVINIQGYSFEAFCLKRNVKRTLLIDNVLAYVPAIRKERGVI